MPFFFLTTVSKIDRSFFAGGIGERQTRGSLHPLSKFLVPPRHSSSVILPNVYFFFPLSPPLSLVYISLTRFNRARKHVRGAPRRGKFTVEGYEKSSPNRRTRAPLQRSRPERTVWLGKRQRRTREIVVPGRILTVAIPPIREPRHCTASTAFAVDRKFRGGDPDGRAGGKFGEVRDTSRYTIWEISCTTTTWSRLPLYENICE